MASTREIALEHYRQRQNFVNATAQVAAQMWAEVDPRNIVNSWAQQVPELTAVVSGAQLGAARQADPYTTDALESQDADPEAVSPVDPAGFSGQASDGRGLMSLLTHPVVVTLMAIQDGMDVLRALGFGRTNLDMITRTQVADAGRLADQAALTARPAASGYVRVAVGNSCARCLILAGRFYQWNAGFKRHPRCDCQHLARHDPRLGRLLRDPRDIYADMSRAERLRAGFTLADQQALRMGADLEQIVNARHRPDALFTAGGRRFTREGATKRGFAGRRLRGADRLTPDQIFAEAQSRPEALQMLYDNGYLLTPPRLSAAGSPTVLFDEARVGGVSRAMAAPDLSKLTAPKLKELAAQRGIAIPPRAKKADIIALLDDGGTTHSRALVPEARARQATLDRSRSTAEMLSEVDELLSNQASPRALRHRIESAAKRSDIPSATVKALLAAADDPVKLRAAMAKAAKGAKLTPSTPLAGEVVPFDRKLMESLGADIGNGELVRIVRPGYSALVDGKRITMVRGGVFKLDAAEASAFRKAEIRRKARERGQAIAQADGTAKLLAEVDELLAKKSTATAIRERLDPKLIEPEQLFANADPAVLRALRTALDSGDMAKLRATVTRLTTKAKIKPLSKAGAKVKFDPDTMDPVGGIDIPAGTRVEVITRGSSVVIDGETVVLTKPRVAPVGPVVKPPPQIAGLPSPGKPPAMAAAAKTTNPRFGETSRIGSPTYRGHSTWTPDLGPPASGAFEENCTNVVHAFELRMRGYPVEAAALDVLDKYGYAAGRTYPELDQLLADAWRLPGGRPHGRSFSGQQWRSFAEVDAEILHDWPDGGRGFIFVGKHIFSVVKVGGKVRYIDAQQAGASGAVTAAYRRKYGSVDLGTGRQEAKLIRVDDLEPASGILATIEVRP